MRTYCIIDSSEVSSVDFDQVLQADEYKLRYSLDGTKTFVKYEGAKPRCLYGKDTLSHSAMLTVLAGEAWTQPMEEL